MNTELPIFARKSLAVLRLVVAALVAGVLMFGGAVIFVKQVAKNFNADLPIIGYVGLGALVVAIVAQVTLVPLIEAAQRRTIKAEDERLQPWLGLFAVRTIVGCAFLEGAAFLCLVGALLGGGPVCYGGGAIAAVLMFALHYPSELKMTSFIERQKELALQERMAM